MLNIMSGIAILIVSLVIITILILYFYYIQESSHRYQLAKIKSLEQKYEFKERQLETLRVQTQQCPVPNLTDPRACYFGSSYTCSWNENIGRCDLII
jgi:hypothetical protein